MAFYKLISMKTLSLLLLSLALSLPATAQKSKSSKAARNKNYHFENLVSKTLYIGPGFGLDYAGLGMKAEVMPLSWIGIFVTGGTNFTGGGYNAGLSFKALPQSKISPTVQGMYGYNGVLVITDGYDKIISSKNYFGLSAGAGVDFTMGKNLNKLSIGIWMPIRSKNFQEDIKTANATVLPVALSLGFKFGVL